MIATSGDAPYDDIASLAAYAKEHEVVLGHFGAPLVPTRVTLGLAKEIGFSFASDAAFDALDCNSLASGDVDVINTTLQQVLPCLDSLKVLASISEERMPLIPDTPTVAELVPNLNISLWNGLFVRKGTPQDIREKIIAVAEKTMMSERARKLATDTGAAVYWKSADDVVEQIQKDFKTLGYIDEVLKK